MTKPNQSSSMSNLNQLSEVLRVKSVGVQFLKLISRVQCLTSRVRFLNWVRVVFQTNHG